MLIEKPTWVKHETDDKHPSSIYSIDVHPDGTRFATGGGDNHARIWAVAPVQDQRAQDDEANHPRLLAIATRHDAAVNVVRWSHDGVNLATGSDDTTIIIWRCLPGVSALGNVENWCSNTMLQGHTSDVKDLGWSPNDDLLATCSIDNTVRVWQMNENTLSQLRLNTPLVVLKGHTSWVRGLCWDPVGKYLASTSDDNTMIVWRTSDWKREVVVEEPFQGAPTVSTVRRLGWSPDGKTICASHAFKHPRHVASIVERTTWTSQLNLVGHETAVGAVRFNNRLFSKDKKGKKNASSSSTSSSKNKLRYRACCAIGSQDATLSVWMAGMPRALAIVHKLFDAEISDLSWNSGGSGGDGLCLFACSLDGSVCCLQFEIGDLGDISPVSKTKERLKALYGASAFATDTMLVESTAQLAMEDESSQSQSSLMNGTTTGISTRRRSTSSSGSNTAAAIPSNQPTMTSAEASLGLSVGAMRASSISSGMRFATSKGTNSPVRLKQRTTKGKGGRKRITPVLIVEKKVEGGNIVDGKARPPAPAKQLSSFPLSSFSSSSSSSSSSTSAAAKDSTNSTNDAIGLKGFIEIHDENSNGAITRVNKEDSEEEDATKKKKKKRIAVTNLTASTSTTSTTSSTSTATSTNATSSTSASSSSSSSGILSSGNGSSKPSKKRVRISTPVPDDVVVHTKTNNDSNKKSNSRQTSKRQRTSSSSSSSSTSSNRSTSNRNAVQGRQLRKPDRKHVYSIVLQNGHSTNNSNPSSASVSSSSSSSSSSLNSSNMTTTPTMLEYRIVPIRTSHGDKVTNDDTNERLDPIRTTVLSCTRGGDLLWRERVTGRAALLAGNGSFCAMATTAGEIYIFSEVGRRLSAPMVLPEPLAFLEVCTAPPSSNNTSTNAHNNNNNDNAASNTTSGTHNNDTTSNPETPTNPSHLLVGLTIHGTVYVWNVIERRIVMKSQECVRALLSSAEAELRAHVHLSHENGNDPAAKQVRADVTRVMLRLSDDSSRAPMIIVTVLADSSANNSKRRKGIGSLNAPVDASALRLCQSFVYDQHMESWNRVADHHFNRSDYTSGFANNLRSQTNSIHGGMRPLDALQATGHDVGSLTGAGAGSSSAALMSDLYEWGDTSQQWYETRAHLEHQIVASRTMVSPIEYSQWLSIYCKFLARDGRESSVQRLREVCNDLMGPPMKHVSKKVWDGVVMDLNKRELLRKKILPAIASNRGLQRIVSEYQDSLDQLEE